MKNRPLLALGGIYLLLLSACAVEPDVALPAKGGAQRPASASARDVAYSPPVFVSAGTSRAPSASTSKGVQKADLAGAPTWNVFNQLSAKDVAHWPTVQSGAIDSAFQDASGNIYAGGDHNANALLKFSPAFALAWEKTATGNSSKAGPSNRPSRKAWALSPSGEMHVTGSVGGSLAPDQPSAGGLDIFVAKFTKDGEPAWVRQIGSPGQDSGHCIAVGRDGAVYLSGSTGGQLPGQPPAAKARPFVMKYSAAGQREWIQQSDALAGRYGAWTRDLAVDAQGNLYLAQSGGDGSGGVKKLSPDGTLLWDHTVGPTISTSPVAPAADRIVLQPSGQRVYTVRFSNAVNNSESYGYNPGLSAFSSDGKLLWFKPLGFESKIIEPVEGVEWTGNFLGENISGVSSPRLLATNDALYVAGRYLNRFKNGSVARRNFQTGFVARYDSSGELVWFQQFVIPQTLIGPGDAPLDLEAIKTRSIPLNITGLHVNPKGEIVVAGEGAVPRENPKRPGKHTTDSAILLLRLAAADGRVLPNPSSGAARVETQTEKSTVSSALSAKVIQDTVGGYSKRFRACYEVLPRPRPTAKVMLSFTIGRDGKVSEGQVESKEHPSLGQCLDPIMRSMVFPAPKDGVVPVIYPVKFAP